MRSDTYRREVSRCCPAKQTHTQESMWYAQPIKNLPWYAQPIKNFPFCGIQPRTAVPLRTRRDGIDVEIGAIFGANRLVRIGLCESACAIGCKRVACVMQGAMRVDERNIAISLQRLVC